MRRRPPTSTLFPYTTLFRSQLTPSRLRKRLPVDLQDTRVTFAYYTPATLDSYLQIHRDRKSTRLNSSHANISYAVFCLKKKTHPPITQPNTPHIQPQNSLDP